MKILIVNFTDIRGGAARAAYRLHESLLDEEIDSSILVQRKISNKNLVHSVYSYFKTFFIIKKWTFDKIPILFYPKKTKAKFSSAWVSNPKMIDTINKINPDIVHLHWIVSGTLSISDLSKIKAPIVWSLHDMWPFTGGCHYSDECDHYTKECGSCKVLNSSEKNDHSYHVLSNKKDKYPLDKMTIVGLSKWITNAAMRSSLFAKNKVIQLPNPINTKLFAPLNQVESRDQWNLPKNKKLILFGAVGATHDPRKGFQYLQQALLNIKNIENYECVVFGSEGVQSRDEIGLKIHYIDIISNDVSLVSLYSATDLMVVPSIQENLSNAIMESLACGTPVLAFDIGGNIDMVDHQINGYLARPFDSTDLAKGIDWIIENNQDLSLSHNARKKIVEQFDYSVVAPKYIELYQEILSK